MIKALAALHIKLWLEMAQENLCTFAYMTQLEILQFQAHMNISSVVGTFNAHCKIFMSSPITQFNHISMTRSKHLFQNIFQNAKKTFRASIYKNGLQKLFHMQKPQRAQAEPCTYDVNKGTMGATSPMCFQAYQS